MNSAKAMVREEQGSGLNEMVSLTEKPCRVKPAGLFSFSDGGSLMNTVTLLGIDIGKHRFHLYSQVCHPK
jgi:hypothetical protein